MLQRVSEAAAAQQNARGAAEANADRLAREVSQLHQRLQLAQHDVDQLRRQQQVAAASSAAAAPSAVGMREDELIRALAAAAGLEQKEGVAALTKVVAENRELSRMRGLQVRLREMNPYAIQEPTAEVRATKILEMVRSTVLHCAQTRRRRRRRRSSKHTA